MARALKQGDIASDRGPVDLETAVRGAWEALDADDGTGFGLILSDTSDVLLR